MTDGESWLWKIKETVEREQQQPVWMSETKFDDALKDEALPLNSRQSMTSSPDNLYDSRSPYDSDAYNSMPRHMTRATSDPNLAPQPAARMVR